MRGDQRRLQVVAGRRRRRRRRRCERRSRARRTSARRGGPRRVVPRMPGEDVGVGPVVVRASTSTRSSSAPASIAAWYRSRPSARRDCGEVRAARGPPPVGRSAAAGRRRRRSVVHVRLGGPAEAVLGEPELAMRRSARAPPARCLRPPAPGVGLGSPRRVSFRSVVSRARSVQPSRPGHGRATLGGDRRVVPAVRSPARTARGSSRRPARRLAPTLAVEQRRRARRPRPGCHERSASRDVVPHADRQAGEERRAERRRLDDRATPRRAARWRRRAPG